MQSGASLDAPTASGGTGISPLGWYGRLARTRNSDRAHRGAHASRPQGGSDPRIRTPCAKHGVPWPPGDVPPSVPLAHQFCRQCQRLGRQRMAAPPPALRPAPTQHLRQLPRNLRLALHPTRRKLVRGSRAHDSRLTGAARGSATRRCGDTEHAHACGQSMPPEFVWAGRPYHPQQAARCRHHPVHAGRMPAPPEAGGRFSRCNGAAMISAWLGRRLAHRHTRTIPA